MNLQFGFAAADAESGDVDVKSLDELEAGENGIDAEFKAVAIADLDQKAEQDNENEVTAEGTGSGPGARRHSVQPECAGGGGDCLG